MIGRVLALLLAIVLLAGGLARAEIEIDPNVTAEHVSVQLNGVSVATDALVYIGDDGIVYVSDSDLDTWRLKRSLRSAFSRTGKRYYGLQSDVHLAATFERRTNVLEIIAQRAAFRGEATATQQSLSTGSGAYLNYQLQREFGDYDLFVGAPAGVFEMRYLSTAGAAGLEFHRSRTRWFHLNADGHYVAQVGDWNTNSDPLIDGIPFAGLHLASDYRGDPTFVTHGLPSVRGIANAPSLVEVYVDNILRLRQDVLAGPFTIDDLPPEAANTDVVLVITDTHGNRTVETVRPSVDPSFLGQGITTFAFDSGVVHRMRDQLGSYYRGAVYSGNVRYGITDAITGTLAAQSTAGKTFGDAGLDVRLGEDHLLSIRTGAGGGRRASTFEYALGRGKFRLSEKLTLNNEQQETYVDLDPFNVVAQIRESTGLQISASPAFTMAFNLDRARENNGYDASLMTAQFRLTSGASTLEIRPLYDFVHHIVYGGLTFTHTFGADRLTERGDVSSQNKTTSGALEYAKGRTSPDDPIQFDVKATLGQDQARRVFVSDEMPAMTASERLEQLNGRTISEPELSGALAFAGRKLYGLKTISGGSSYGMLHLDGLSNVAVSVNDRPAGTTDAKGNLLLRDLAPFRQNVITVSNTGLPLGTTILDPDRVTPSEYTPVSLHIPVIAHGSFTLRITDAVGVPLAPASSVRGGGRDYPVGYDGRVYVLGSTPGTQTFTATSGERACSVTIEVPRDTSAVPDLGTAVCR